MSNLFVSFMRTVVPIVAGAVLSAATRIGWDLDDAGVTAYVTAGLTAAYYAAFRLLEELAERMAWEPLRLLAGVLLGWARPPQYVAPVTAPVRMKLDKAAMREDIDSFVRYLGTALDGKGGGDGGRR
ncbi:hypothetical protein [Streptomyces ipomoeae]|uniref:hypothetical protein n=1 Tax=Streptomyces ipomoeae TaxID=103232 RepID=UPI0011461B7F|nr:hypothetical protein [Streptomyces ipomoeae]TQE35483.1 hypothetical protein Sipo7851_14575 [Streptomyces ipomoeae]